MVIMYSLKYQLLRQRESTLPLIKKLSADNVRLNVTAVYTIEQVKAITDAVTEGPNLCICICR